MHDGWEYVLTTYLLTSATLGVWFWMIGVKLRRQRRSRQEQARG